jgi:hypothetical protein
MKMTSNEKNSTQKLWTHFILMLIDVEFVPNRVRISRNMFFRKVTEAVLGIQKLVM